MLPRMHTEDPDPRPEAPKEPELEDCCGTGCVVCVFDVYQFALENYERALKAWEARHPELADQDGPGQPGPR
jgi:hypothetical protein